MFDQFPSLLTFLCPKKSFYLYGQFCDRCHNSNKVFDTTFENLCHYIEYLNLLWIFRWWHVFIAYILFGFGSFLSLEIIKSKIIPVNTINAQFFGFKLIPYSLHFWKHNLSFCRWLSMSLYIIKSSRNIFINIL